MFDDEYDGIDVRRRAPEKLTVIELRERTICQIFVAPVFVQQVLQQVIHPSIPTTSPEGSPLRCQTRRDSEAQRLRQYLTNEARMAEARSCTLQHLVRGRHNLKRWFLGVCHA